MERGKRRAVAVAAAVGAAVSVAGGATTNLLKNAGFESASSAIPQAWEAYASDGEPTAALSTATVRSGRGALILSTAGGAGQFNGIVQAIEVNPGDRYEMTAYVHACGTNLLEGQAYGQIVAEWKAADGTEIARTWSDAWDRKMSLTSWRKVRIEAVAPEGAAKGVFGVHLFDGDAQARGSVLVDDVVVTAVGGAGGPKR